MLHGLKQTEASIIFMDWGLFETLKDKVLAKCPALRHVVFIGKDLVPLKTTGGPGLPPFPSGSDLMTPEGLAAMDQLASAIIELEGQIPKEIEWALQVDGHTDAQPISTPQFPSNWELSTARAVEVVRFLIDQRIPPRRLVAAGFGEHHPLDPGNTPAALARNRRIEFKLTSR